MKPKTKLAHLFLWLASCLRGCGKMLLPKSIVVDVLSLPGWFIIDEMIIHQAPLAGGKLIGFQWDYWPMSEPWITEMNKLKRKL